MFGQRLYEIRKRRGWSQTELAERLADYGRPMHRTTIAKIETPGNARARNVPLEDVLAISVVLGVAPVHMFVPLADDDRVKIVEGLAPAARTAREWVRGRGMISDTNHQLFWSEQPEHERDAMLEQSREAAERIEGAEPIDQRWLDPGVPIGDE